MEDRMGAAFIGSIITINASGGDSSYDKASSSMSIQVTVPGSSRQQSFNSISSSSEDLSYSVHMFQFGDIVGSELGSVSLSSNSSNVVHIASSGNSKGSNFYGWESRSATISSFDNFSAYAMFHNLTGSNGGSGDWTDGANGLLLWSISSGTSIVGTMTSGTAFQYGTQDSITDRPVNVRRGKKGQEPNWFSLHAFVDVRDFVGLTHSNRRCDHFGGDVIDDRAFNPG